jgi:hypothetical protein
VVVGWIPAPPEADKLRGNDKSLCITVAQGIRTIYSGKLITFNYCI